MPKGASLGDLNQACRAGDAADDARRIGARASTVGEDFAVEAAYLLALPAERFDPARYLPKLRADAKARVCVRQCFYSVPARLAGKALSGRLGAGFVEVYDGSLVVARHPRQRQRGDQSLVLDHYLEVLARKPGALPGSVALAQARASGAFSPAHEAYWAEARRRLGDGPGTRALCEVLLLHRRLAKEVVETAIRAALSAGSVDPGVVAVEARRGAEVAEVAPVVAIGPALAPRPAPSLARYDSLLGAKEVAS